MPVAKKTIVDTSINVMEVRQGTATFRLLGQTPLIQEAVGPKARRELLLPSGRKNATERATTLKHQPYEEFLASTYRVNDGPTALAMPVEAFKDALRTAALDLTGVSKAEIGRLTYVVGHMIPVWGVPEIIMSVVRSSDINRTPDIRSRPILRRWAAEITIRYVQPKVTEQAIVRLLAAAGITCGVGGWRQEKGSGNYGLWRIVEPELEEEYQAVVAAGGREAQLEGLAAPACYDAQTSSDLAWYGDELEHRRLRGAVAS